MAEGDCVKYSSTQSLYTRVEGKKLSIRLGQSSRKPGLNTFGKLFHSTRQGYELSEEEKEELVKAIKGAYSGHMADSRVLSFFEDIGIEFNAENTAVMGGYLYERRNREVPLEEFLEFMNSR